MTVSLYCTSAEGSHKLYNCEPWSFMCAESQQTSNVANFTLQVCLFQTAQNNKEFSSCWDWRPLCVKPNGLLCLRLTKMFECFFFVSGASIHKRPRGTESSNNFVRLLIFGPLAHSCFHYLAWQDNLLVWMLAQTRGFWPRSTPLFCGAVL